MRTFWLVFSFLVVGVAHAQGAYRWVDQDGKVHYGDRPPPSAAGKAKPFRPTVGEVEKELPIATRQAMENFPVTLYVSEECGAPCTDARAHLRKRGVPFTEKNVATKEDADALGKLTGGQAGLPSLTAGSKARKGFESGDWDGLLDAAGYPKAARN